MNREMAPEFGTDQTFRHCRKARNGCNFKLINFMRHPIVRQKIRPDFW